MPHPTMPALFPNARADAQGLARRVWLFVRCNFITQRKAMIINELDNLIEDGESYMEYTSELMY